jgi:hypothetical protein
MLAARIFRNCMGDELQPSAEGNRVAMIRPIQVGSAFRCSAELSMEPRRMKTKTWKVMTNTGKQADLEAGI